MSLTPTTTGTVRLRELKHACSGCSLRELCLPLGLDETDWNQLDATITMRRRVTRGEALYRVGDEFSALFAVRFGSFKATTLSPDGRDQVTAFHMPGELMGLDGIATHRHDCQAVALEDSEVCVMPFEQLEDLSRDIPALQRHLHRVLSKEIVRDHQMMLLLGNMRAEERLAAFLLNLSQRYQQRGYSSSEFVLRMTREEIGSYLGIKLETVSRLFSRFQDAGLIRVQQKEVKLLDISGIRALIGNPC